jgi:hypothetical protein
MNSSNKEPNVEPRPLERRVRHLGKISTADLEEELARRKKIASIEPVKKFKWVCPTCGHTEYGGGQWQGGYFDFGEVWCLKCTPYHQSLYDPLRAPPMQQKNVMPNA